MEIVESYSWSDRLTSAFVKAVPFSLVQLYTQYLTHVLLNTSINISSDLSLPDKKCLETPGAIEYFLRDREESLKKNSGFGLAKDYELLNKGWDFDLQDIRREFKGKKIHLWQGDVDTIVPLKLQQCVHKAMPEVVDLHTLHNEGHFSWFRFDPEAPKEILRTLFGSI